MTDKDQTKINELTAFIKSLEAAKELEFKRDYEHCDREYINKIVILGRTFAVPFDPRCVEHTALYNSLKASSEAYINYLVKAAKDEIKTLLGL